MATFTGTVVEGDKLGRTIGFPTANIRLSSYDLPKAGIYAGWAKISHEDVWYKAAIHIGPRPVVKDAESKFEAHLLDFPNQNLYGKNITIQLVSRIRDVQDYPSLDMLRDAIQADCDHVTTTLTYPPD